MENSNDEAISTYIESLEKELLACLSEYALSIYHTVIDYAKHDGFYANKLIKNIMFAEAERDIALYIKANLPIETKICEVGMGCGQLCILLAAMGYQVIGCDSSIPRCNAAFHLRQAIGKTNAQVLNNFTVVQGQYPTAVNSTEFDLLITTNIINGWWDSQPGTEQEKLDFFVQRKSIILDTRTWWVHRPEPEQQTAVVNSLAAPNYYNINKIDTSCYAFMRKAS